MPTIDFLQDARYDITELIGDVIAEFAPDNLTYRNAHVGGGKLYFDFEIEDTTLTIELSVSIIDCNETIKINRL